jgi:hypothetical protein
MKTIITSIILGLIALLSTTHAQLIPYLPAEHIETARTEAEKTITDPQLLSIITINDAIPFQGNPIPIAFDTGDSINRGKSSAWVYCFNTNENPEDFVAIAVGVIPTGPMAFPIPTDDPSVNILFEYVSTTHNLESVEWISSETMLDYLQESTEYQTFLSDNPDATVWLVSLGFGDIPGIDPLNPYWFITMKSETDTTLIIVDALEGDITNIEQNEKQNIAYTYPNPTQDIINLKLSNRIFNKNAIYRIYDINGRELFSGRIGNDSEILKINVSNLNNGSYFIQYIFKNKVKSGLFRINR